jgi:hypothetical protein
LFSGFNNVWLLGRGRIDFLPELNLLLADSPLEVRKVTVPEKLFVAKVFLPPLSLGEQGAAPVVVIFPGLYVKKFLFAQLFLKNLYSPEESLKSLSRIQGRLMKSRNLPSFLSRTPWEF